MQNPLTQLKAANDVVMFQLDHFRSAASQVIQFLCGLQVKQRKYRTIDGKNVHTDCRRL